MYGISYNKVKSRKRTGLCLCRSRTGQPCRSTDCAVPPQYGDDGTFPYDT